MFIIVRLENIYFKTIPSNEIVCQINKELKHKHLQKCKHKVFLIRNKTLLK